MYNTIPMGKSTVRTVKILLIGYDLLLIGYYIKCSYKNNNKEGRRKLLKARDTFTHWL